MFTTLIIEPFTNLMLLAYVLLGNNIVLAIVTLTVVLRLLMIPLTAKQQKSQKKMQAMQPQFQEIREKYKDNPERMQKELLKIGYNPLSMLGGGCLPMLIQFPIWIGMYRSILFVIPNGPVSMIDLYQSHYAALFPNFEQLIPIASRFLWFNLSQPDRLFLPFLPELGIPILPVIVVVTTFLQQKLMTPPSSDPNDQSAQMQRTMLFTMPLMFGFFALQFASGLSIYFIVSNIIGTIQFGYMNRERLELKPTQIPFIKIPSFKPEEVAGKKKKKFKPAGAINDKKAAASSGKAKAKSRGKGKKYPQTRSRRKKNQLRARSAHRRN